VGFIKKILSVLIGEEGMLEWVEVASYTGAGPGRVD